MCGTTAFFYNDELLKYQFGPEHPYQPIRFQMIRDTLRELGVFDERLSYVESPLANDEDLLEVHDPHHIDYVKEMSRLGTGYLDSGDTPASPGLYEGALATVGATLAGVESVARGEYDHAMTPGGGLHHARRDRSAGFSVFNDLAVAVRRLQRRYGYERIAILDIDGHHGDGTQSIFNREKVLTVSFHRYSPGFYPGTGAVTDVGEGEGKGYAINVPLPRCTCDEVYVPTYEKVVSAALDAYRPEIVLHQFGTDAHYSDHLVGMGLTTAAYEKVADITHRSVHQHCDGRYIVTGGGGYSVDATRRIWTIAVCIVSGSFPQNPEGLHMLRDSGLNRRWKVQQEELQWRIDYIFDEVLPLIR
ncbi:MAG: acetoin utilization protein AcuC [Methanomassiliicoccales archaeon]|nr:acetoin utilization protein AcuC [Methanomassiliicoccales archaeon]